LKTTSVTLANQNDAANAVKHHRQVGTGGNQLREVYGAAKLGIFLTGLANGLNERGIATPRGEALAPDEDVAV
jgi:hypothetical protein